MRGFSRLVQLREDVLFHGRRIVQYVVVPISNDPKSCSFQDRVSLGICLVISMLAAVNLDDQALLKANEIENEVLHGCLTAKLVSLKSAITEQTPHDGLCLSRLTSHRLGEAASPSEGRPMAR
ncbi:hypothetical protein BRAS3843_2770021 [Bradyrhizobium sp. STM 3843]|nr:hypothetical protein BRAS3843_2770021 [Bradyrhizobium sp. STM 3843]